MSAHDDPASNFKNNVVIVDAASRPTHLTDDPFDQIFFAIRDNASKEMRDVVRIGIESTRTASSLMEKGAWEFVPRPETLKGLRENTLELMSRGENLFQATARTTGGAKSVSENIPIRPKDARRAIKLLNIIGTAHSMLVQYAEANQLREIFSLLTDIRTTQKANRDGALISCAKEIRDLLSSQDEKEGNEDRLFLIKRELYRLQEQYLREASFKSASFESSNSPFLTGLNPASNSSRERATVVIRDCFEMLYMAHKAFRLQALILGLLGRHEEEKSLSHQFTSELEKINLKLDAATKALPFKSQQQVPTEERVKVGIQQLITSVDLSANSGASWKSGIRIQFESINQSPRSKE